MCIMRKKNMLFWMFVMSMITLLSIMLQNKKLVLPTDKKEEIASEYSPTGIPDRWIVTSTLQMSDVTEIPGWIILLYEPGSHETCRHPYCVTLGDWHPHPVILNSVKHIQPNASREHRRLSAYLFAISQGAAYICITERLYISTVEMITRFIYKGTTTGVVPITDISYVQPSTLFIRETSVSNAADNLLKKPHNMFYQYVINENVSPAIQLFTTLVRNTYYSDILEELPPVFLPAKTFTSLDSDVILFRYDAFWALAMYELHSASGQLLMQKLAWFHGQSVGVFPVLHGTEQLAQHHSPTPDAWKQQVLNTWRGRPIRRYDIIIYLLRFCHEQKLLSDGEMDLISLYLEELQNIGYNFPKPVENETVFDPIKQTFGVIKIPEDTFPESEVATKALNVHCPKARMDFTVKCNSDIGLIVTFNTIKLYRNIPLLESMYRPYFKHILYCGPNLTAFLSHAHNSSIGYYIFIEAFKQKWLFMYDCTAEAMKLNLNVKGFLQIGDDTILNSWNVYDLPRDKIWLHTGMKQLPVSTQKYDWAFWGSIRRRVVQLLNEMQGLSIFNNTSIINRFVSNFHSNSANMKHIFISGCDFMYMPSRLKEEFALISDIFTQHGIMLEGGFANMAMGLQSRKDIHFVQDGSLWRRNRTLWASVYNKDLIFMHPFKMGTNLLKVEGQKILCADYFNSPFYSEI